MPLVSDSSYSSTNNGDSQGRSMQSQDSFDFLDNPFGSVISSIAFLGLCGFAITSIYILIQKYRQAREYHPRPVSNLGSARALATGIDTCLPGMWQAEPELVTADLVGVREGSISDFEEFSPFAISPHNDTESNKGLEAGCGHGDVDGRRMMQHENATARFIDAAGETLDEDKAEWVKRKQAGEDLDQVKKAPRSRMFIPNGVVMGQVRDGTIAQRRRAGSNRSLWEL